MNVPTPVLPFAGRAAREQLHGVLPESGPRSHLWRGFGVLGVSRVSRGF